MGGLRTLESVEIISHIALNTSVMDSVTNNSGSAATYQAPVTNASVSVIGTGFARPLSATAASLLDPTLLTTASSAVTLGTTAPSLSDSAVLSGGISPTGSITLTLTGPGGFSFTQTDTVNGNGTYTAGDTLPTTGLVAGTYTWSAAYSGDGTNASAVDQGGTAEQTVVSPASPSLVTTASEALAPAAVVPTVSDSAALSGGFFETGSITFTLTGPGGFSYTQTDTVNGDGIYTAGTPLGTSGQVAGTYTWSAVYSGDGNNASTQDQGGTAEQTVVLPATPSLVTTASSAATLGATAPTLADSAALAGGFFETGSITFTLSGPGGFSFTQTDTVNGDGMYTAGTPLGTSGQVAGTYTWSAVYSGDGNNASTQDQGGTAEQTVASPASPNMLTMASSAVTLGTTAPGLSDSAVLAGGFFETGSITFTLTGPGGLSYTQTDTVNGDGTYTAGTPLGTSGQVAGTYTWSAVYSGDGNNASTQDQGGTAEQTVVSPASPNMLTMASSAVTLGTTAPSLSDSAVLSGGFFETGSITFTLTGPGGFSFTQTDTVNGDGTYTAGTALGTSGQVAGTYTWSATYSGDGNNTSAQDQGGTAEQTVVSPASPGMVTTASPGNITLGTSGASLSDSAVLSGGFFETGSVTFTLTGPGGFSFTQTDTVNGNGTYTAGDILTAGAAVGTYIWSAVYNGDGNNLTAQDQGDAAEQTIVSSSTQVSLVTTASPAVTLATTAPTLSDSAVLSGGVSPTGTMTFTLTGPGGFSYTQTDTVNGDGTYTAGDTLATAGTVAGTYTWSANYSGDTNNNSASDQGGTGEQTVVSAASPNLVTTASGAVTIGSTGATLSDSAVLSGGFFETGSITFTLTGPGGFSFTQTDTVNGDGTYTAGDMLTAGGATGTYTWSAAYSGDSNNLTAQDQGGTAEQTVVSAATSLSLVTTASGPVTLSSGKCDDQEENSDSWGQGNDCSHGGDDGEDCSPGMSPTLSDTAVLSGANNPTGTITFTLTGPGGFSFTQTDTVNGNGTYTAADMLPTAGMVAGIYAWSAHYSGDTSNASTNDQGGTAEQTIVSPASPTLLTRASHDVTLGSGEHEDDGEDCSQGDGESGCGSQWSGSNGAAPTLTDKAVLSGGFFETGTITFTLTGPGGFSYTQTDTVNGNGTYTASDTLTAGAAAGTYAWSAVYSGDTNNASTQDQGGRAEQTNVGAPNPSQGTAQADSFAGGTWWATAYASWWQNRNGG
jgi:hypothetical protein